MLPRELFLVRHGQSEGNIANSRSRKGDHSDFTPEFMNRHSADLHLTYKGRAQAVFVGDWLKESDLADFDAFYVSPYARALETAALLKLSNAMWSQPDYRLRERDHGSVDIIPNDLRKKRMAGYFESLGSMPYHHFYTPLPGGESICDVTNRLRSFIDALDSEFPVKRAVVVAHGDVMRAFRVILEQISPDSYHQLKQEDAVDFRIGNGQIIHYTRINPNPTNPTDYGNERFDRFGWVRSINPWKPGYAGHDWQEIKPQFYTNEKLMALAERSKRLVSE